MDATLIFIKNKRNYGNAVDQIISLNIVYSKFKTNLSCWNKETHKRQKGKKKKIKNKKEKKKKRKRMTRKKLYQSSP